MFWVAEGKGWCGFDMCYDGGFGNPSQVVTLDGLIMRKVGAEVLEHVHLLVG